MFHLAAMQASLGVNAADTALAAVSDTVFGTSGTSFILTDDVDLIGAAYLAASATRARFNSPTFNRYARQQLWPINRSATPPSPARLMDLRNMPIRLPKVEQFFIEGSNNLGAATEVSTAFLFLAPPGWTRNLIPGQIRIIARATATVARVAAAWSGPGAITFSEALLGGWWAINGVYCQSANLRAFRLFFPRAPGFAGRSPMRPGHLVTNALGDHEPIDMAKDELGTWGAFHTFEPVQLEVFGDVGGADTQELRFDLTYLGGTDQGRYPLGLV